MTFVQIVMNYARRAAKRQDLVLVGLLALTVFMIILPMPTWLVDALIGVNLSFVVLILIVSVYLKDPVEFSTLPAVILICTLFRLAISISTTRLILSEGDAGQIVETFGLFVVGGSLIVGLVVFLIITAVQFIVVTKGSERVAEVAARFSLDALPGKQMAIDADVRAGEIDAGEARARRAALQTESEFYGAMDGAMKFVKGDAIAGLIIIGVNLIGGLSVGIITNGMPVSEAIALYAILTVGDGLVSQIPALLVAISCGTVVTRVTSDGTSNLGEGIASQLSTNPRTLQISGVVLFGFALVPGFPWHVFVVLGSIFVGVGTLLWRATPQPEASFEDLPSTESESAPREHENTPMTLAVAPKLLASLDVPALHSAGRVERDALYGTLGVIFPPFRIVEAPLAQDGFELLVDGVPVASGTLPQSKIFALDTAEHVALVGVEPEAGPPILGGGATVLVDQTARATLAEAGIETLGPESALAKFVAHELPGQAEHFVGIQETRTLLSGIEQTYGELVKETLKHVPISKLSEVLRRLVEERIPVRNLRTILEALVEWGQKEKDAAQLAEYARCALSRQICHRYAVRSRSIPAFLLDAKSDEAIRESIRHTSSGSHLALGADRSRKLLSAIRTKVGNLDEHDGTPVVLTTMDVRRFLRAFFLTNGVDVPILSHKEIARDFEVQPLATISL